MAGASWGAARLTAHCSAVRGRTCHARVTAYVPTPVLLILAAIPALKVGLSLLSGTRTPPFKLAWRFALNDRLTVRSR